MLGALANEFEWYEAEGMPYGGVYRGRENLEGLSPALTVGAASLAAGCIRSRGTKRFDLRVLSSGMTGIPG